MTELSEEVYHQAKSAVVHGWMMPEKCKWFEQIYDAQRNLQPIVAVEIGVFYGMSAIAQGLLAQRLGVNCVLFAIDAWTAEASLEGTNSKDNDEWWKQQNYDDAFNTFKSAINILGLNNCIIPVKSKSEDAASRFEQIHILHIDGNHSEEKSTLDVELYLPKVVNGGYIILDDTNWQTVKRAAEMLAEQCAVIKQVEKDGQAFTVYVKR